MVEWHVSVPRPKQWYAQTKQGKFTIERVGESAKHYRLFHNGTATKWVGAPETLKTYVDKILAGNATL